MPGTAIATAFRDIVVGAVSAGAAVLLRYILGLPADTLPFFTVVIAICLVTVATGIVGGVSAMVVGGLLAWYFILTPGQFGVEGTGAFTLVGFSAVSLIILISSQLYRLSERNKQETALAVAVREAEQQSLFAREMSHRLKNAMAIVQAMATQSFDQDNPDVDKFNGRLKALADAHNLLNDHVKQPSASLRSVVESATRAFQHRGRVTVDGPDINIPDQQVISIALALHELCTNATKYGALSNEEGRVEISWQKVDGRYRLEWKEHGGPPVSPPVETGFGTRLLKRAAMGSEIRFEPDGVRCTITQRF
jgi:two-component sensor histidine kinase